jgi:hypothetical protein
VLKQEKKGHHYCTTELAVSFSLLLLLN